MSKNDRGVLVRALKFEIEPQGNDLKALQTVSQNMRLVWNEALEVRNQVFREHYAPLYEELKLAGSDAEKKEIKRRLKEAFAKRQVHKFDQIKALAPRRAGDALFRAVPRDWQMRTLLMLDGAFSSFLALRKNGDKDARQPREKDEGFFSEIYGGEGFAIEDVGEKKFLLLRPGSVGAHMRFEIPGYQSGKLREAEGLGNFAVKQFTLCRTPRKLSEPGRYYVSLVYEYVRPEVEPDIPDSRVYIAVGASSLGVHSPQGVEVLELWRPDKYWKPKIEAVEARMKPLLKGSRKHKKLAEARRKMFDILAKQQRQHHAEVVQRLLKLGVHFVVTEHVVRSKDGCLADHGDAERRGSLGLNWAAQNTGNIAAFVAQLQVKVSEHGGSVTKYKLPLTDVPRFQGEGHHNKKAMVYSLRESYMRSQPVAA